MEHAMTEHFRERGYVAGEDEPMDDLDHAVLDELARLYAATDPVPAGLVDSIAFELTLAGLHAEVAELQRGEPLLVRGDHPHDIESLTFTGTRVSLMITVTRTDGDTVRLDGWVTRGGTTVELVHGTEHTPAVADDRGRLKWEGVPHGMVRFLVRGDGPDDPATITPRVEI
jgi:hypothetical protein